MICSVAVIQRILILVSYRYQVGIFTGVSAKQGSWTQQMDFFLPTEFSWLLAYINKSQQVITQMTWSPRNAISIFHPSLLSTLGAQLKLQNALWLKKTQFTNKLIRQALAEWFVFNPKTHFSGLVIRSLCFGHHLPSVWPPLDTAFSPLNWFF